MPPVSMLDSDLSLPVPPALSDTPPLPVCRLVFRVTAEMSRLSAHRIVKRRDRRRMLCHIRQIAMYVCHVVLRMTQTQIGEGFRRDRSTVGHACHKVEDRRDEPGYDEFVSAVERMVTVIFQGEERSGPDAA